MLVIYAYLHGNPEQMIRGFDSDSIIYEDNLNLQGCLVEKILDIKTTL